MLKNILVPLDSSSYSWSAAQHAIQMAHSYRATIHGLYAIDARIIKGQLLRDLKVDSTTARNLYRDKGRALLEQLEGKCKDANVQFRPVMIEGAVSDSIRDIASQVNAELTVMGKKGTSAQWTGPLLGSIAESVTRQARRPVFLAQEEYVPIKAVYVAYDGGLVSIRAVRFTADLCARCRWDMRVISVHSSKERTRKLLREAVEMAELYRLKIATIGRSGDVTGQIINAASEEPNALIVLGAYSKRLRRLMLGGVPEQVMRKAPQPVLIYRPLPS